jgi:uncharacterized protein
VIFLDTSHLVKLYIEEPDSTAVRARVGDRKIVVSDITFTEVHSAVRRRQREGTLTARQASSILRAIVTDWPRLVRVAISQRVLGVSAELLERHALRTLDALQLASAKLVVDGAPAALSFGATDRRLLTAAAAEGLEVGGDVR